MSVLRKEIADCLVSQLIAYNGYPSLTEYSLNDETVFLPSSFMEGVFQGREKTTFVIILANSGEGENTSDWVTSKTSFPSYQP